jgi:hypothetical protein
MPDAFWMALRLIIGVVGTTCYNFWTIPGQQLECWQWAALQG